MITDEQIRKMKNTKKKSVLFEHFDEIRILRENDIPYVVIAEWLNDKGVVTSMQNVRMFCIRNNIEQKHVATKEKETTSKPDLNNKISYFGKD